MALAGPCYRRKLPSGRDLRVNRPDPNQPLLKVRLEKKGIRALGIAESFKPGASRESTLGGVVMRGDLVVDSMTTGLATLEGDDATDSVIEMYEDLHRNDVNIIMLGGAIISLYNVVDVDRVGSETSRPVICITFKESEGLENSLKRHFPRRWKSKLTSYSKLGGREKIELKTGYHVFVRTSGIDPTDARTILDKFTLQGAVPEPIRLAKMLSRARRA